MSPDPDAFLRVALARPEDFDDTAFLPLSPADAERQRTQAEAVGRTLTQAQLGRVLDELYHPILRRPLP